MTNKYLINRARPEQVDPSIKPIDKSTAQTPAFPAGHAFQAYLLSKKLSEKYPEKKKFMANWTKDSVKRHQEFELRLKAKGKHKLSFDDLGL